MDLDNLDPKLVEAVKAIMREGALDAQGRSPIRPRQLTNLIRPPKWNDPRPLFVPSAESPTDGSDLPVHEFPKLLWHATTGEEITVHGAAEEAARLQSGYQHTMPFAVAIDPEEKERADLQRALASLSETDRQLVLEQQKGSRLEAIRAKLAALTEDEVQELVGELPKAKKAKAS